MYIVMLMVDEQIDSTVGKKPIKSKELSFSSIN